MCHSKVTHTLTLDVHSNPFLSPLSHFRRAALVSSPLTFELQAAALSTCHLDVGRDEKTDRLKTKRSRPISGYVPTVLHIVDFVQYPH